MWFRKHVKCVYFVYLIAPVFFISTESLRQYTKADIKNFREEVREMFQHAYEGYLEYASDYDELRPLSCDGVDTWGSYSLTLIDALDTLAVMGNYTEFDRVVKLLTEKTDFNKDINVSVFETNIRIVGGLLSSHLMSRRAGIDLQPGWPCNGPLLQLAEDVARRLLPAFDTKTGMPYGTVNLRYGVPAGETPITCTAGVGTFIVEFGTLSRLTGDPIYEEVALNALYALWKYRSPICLFGNHIDVQTGRWTAQDSGIGAGVDSYYEYLVKGAIMLNRPDLLEMFHEGRKAIEKHLKRDDWYVWVSMNKGQVTLPVFQSLEAYWPGVLSFIGETNSAMKTLHNYHSIWRQYGFLPEFYKIASGEAGANRENYPLRPELIESTMYLYRATRDPFLLDVGVDMLRSIQHSARTPCGYATIKNVRDHRKEDRMESFFLAETTKYLYLLFDPDNFLHNDGREGEIFSTPNGECLIEAGGYIFNTEAHPIDPSALKCCHDLSQQNDIFENFQIEEYYGEVLEKVSTTSDDFVCPEPSWNKSLNDLTIDIEADIDSNLAPGEKFTAESLKTMQSTSEFEIDTKIEEDQNDEVTQLWVPLINNLGNILLNLPKSMTLTEEQNEQIVVQVKQIMENTKLKQKQDDFFNTLEKYVGKSGSTDDKSVYELYKLELRYRVSAAVIDKILTFIKNTPNENKNVLEIIHNVYKAVEPDSTESLDENQKSMLHIIQREEQLYHLPLNNAISMLKFVVQLNISEMAQDENVKIFLQHYTFEQSPDIAIDLSFKLDQENLKYIEFVFIFTQKFVEVMHKKSELLMQALKVEENLQKTKSGSMNVDSENLITVPGKDFNILGSDDNDERKRNSYLDNDDIILVENKKSEDTGYKEGDLDVGVGTVELVDLQESPESESTENTDEVHDNSKYIKPIPSSRSNILIGSQFEDPSNDSVLTHLVQSMLTSSFPVKPKFEPQLLLEKIRSQNEYSNYSKNFELFTCKAQPYVQIMSIWGEVY